jgi:hypothetical protein
VPTTDEAPTKALVPKTGPAAMQLALELGAVTTATSLDITNPDLTYEAWESIGRTIGFVGSAWQWWVGDWLNFGEELYGEEHAQAIEATTQERYSMAERITGVEHGTMMNIRSICGKIARSRRVEGLPFWVHAEVAALEPEEQTEWLVRAHEEGWNRDALRQAIKDKKHPPEPGSDNDDAGDGNGDGMTVGERIEQAARLVWHQAQSTTDGSYLIPPEPMAQLAAALGEE